VTSPHGESDDQRAVDGRHQAPPAPVALDPADVAGAAELIAVAFGESPYAELPRWALSQAARGGNAEYQALVARLGEGRQVAAVVVFGLADGAEAAGTLYALAASSPELGRALADEAARIMRAGGARFLMCEIADDPVLDRLSRLLLQAGFVEESRVPDLYRDGVALRFLRRELGAAPDEAGAAG
jgi:ribosomal protein S18 acetylase RimI-like enzyme